MSRRRSGSRALDNTILANEGTQEKMSEPHDMKAANSMYDGFIGTLKWSIPLIAIIVFIVVLLIS